MRARLALLACAVVVLVAGLAVREFTTGAFAKYAGVALYAALVYTVAAAVAVRLRPVALAGIGLLVCWLVEFASLTGVPAELAAHSTLLRLALGTTFHALDLFWYGVGVAAAALLHWSVRRRLGLPRGARRWSTLAALLAVAIAVLWLGYHVTAAHEAQRLTHWVHAVRAAGRVATSLHSERREAVAVVRGSTESDYERRIANTDNWLSDTYTPTRKDLGRVSGAPADLNRRIDDQLAELPQLRARVRAGAASAPLVAEVMHAYGALISDLLRFRQEAAVTWHAPAAVTAQIRAAASLAWAVEFAARQQVMVSSAIAHGPVTEAVAKQITQTRDDLNTAVRDTIDAAPQWRKRVRQALDQRWAAEAARLEQTVTQIPPGQHLDIDGGLWRSVGIWRVQELQDVQYDIEVAVAQSVDYVPRQHWTWFWSSLWITAFATLLISFVVRVRRVL